jgi:hypothetical protein
MAEDDPSPAAPKRARARRNAAATPGVAETAAPVVGEDGSSTHADRIDVHMSALGRVDATAVSVAQGAIGGVRADHVSVDRGAVGAALADRVEVSRGYARSIVARQVTFDRAAARVVIAADVNARQSAVMFLIARRVAGDVKVLFDWRGALAFGAVAGLLFAAVSRLRRRPR